MHTAFAIKNKKQKLISIYPVATSQFEKWIASQSTSIQQWVKTSQFTADSGTFCFIPNSERQLECVILGVNHADDFLAFGALPATLPEGNYVIDGNAILKTPHHFQQASLGWGLGFYQFAEYKKPQPRAAKLILHKQVDEKSLTIMLDSIYLSRDLINTPAEDMGPDQLEKETSIKEIEKNIFVVNALTPITDFNRYFNTHFDDEDFETIGGLVLRKLGHLPKRNEKIKLGHFEVLVIKATRRGIKMLQFRKLK
jgi:leucyl aminopeptidase